jgi:hypothetical protein
MNANSAAELQEYQYNASAAASSVPVSAPVSGCQYYVQQAGVYRHQHPYPESLASIHRPIKILRFLRFDSIYDLIQFEHVSFAL